MALPNFPSAWISEEHALLQDTARRYIAEKWTPHAAEWREAGRFPVSAWREAAAAGLLCVSTEEQYGGGGGDFGGGGASGDW